MAEQLLAAGAAVGVTNVFGVSPLHKASEAVAYVRRRADEFGRSWASIPAASPAMAHDFCGWLEV